MNDKYEKARIIGARALQISESSPVLVKVNGYATATSIAEKEFEAKKMPLEIVRKKDKEVD